MLNAISLVKNTRFEALVARIQKDQEENHNSDLNRERKRYIVRSIASVYFFLRREYGMTAGSLTIDDYRTAYEALMEIACKRVKEWKYRMLPSLLCRNTAWGYFLAHGYFHMRRTPFGLWFNSVGYNVYYYAGSFLDNPATVREDVLPRNFKELVSTVYEEKYGKNGGRNE